MPTESSKVVARNERGEVLLVLRKDMRIWVLPGGGREPGESYEHAAVREVREETGYDVALERLVGVYRRPQMPQGGDVQRLYAARVIGGDSTEHDRESLDVRWFAPQALPKRLTRFCLEQIEDGLADRDEPFEKEQRLPWPQSALLRLFSALRGARNRTLRRR